MSKTGPKTVIIGISGVSTSGKTTLARLLRDIFHGVLIIHEDDFYLPDDRIPVKGGLKDWDCLESLDLEGLRESLQFIKSHGRLPPDLYSKEDQNKVQESNVDKHLVSELKAIVAKSVADEPRPLIVIVEGFLLYAQAMTEVWSLMDVRLFLRARHDTAVARRGSRAGYVTLDGFWEDPPGYVDKVVWPNYVQDHAFLFVDGNVEGHYDEETCKEMSLRTMPDEAEGDMTKCLSWAFGQVQDTLHAYSASNE